MAEYSLNFYAKYQDDPVAKGRIKFENTGKPNESASSKGTFFVNDPNDPTKSESTPIIGTWWTADGHAQGMPYFVTFQQNGEEEDVKDPYISLILASTATGDPRWSVGGQATFEVPNYALDGEFLVTGLLVDDEQA